MGCATLAQDGRSGGRWLHRIGVCVMRSILLWLLGVPISVIVLLNIFNIL
jgi:hypothetical protein